MLAGRQWGGCRSRARAHQRMGRVGGPAGGHGNGAGLMRRCASNSIGGLDSLQSKIGSRAGGKLERVGYSVVWVEQAGGRGGSLPALACRAADRAARCPTPHQRPPERRSGGGAPAAARAGRAPVPGPWKPPPGRPRAPAARCTPPGTAASRSAAARGSSTRALLGRLPGGAAWLLEGPSRVGGDQVGGAHTNWARTAAKSRSQVAALGAPRHRPLAPTVGNALGLGILRIKRRPRRVCEGEHSLWKRVSRVHWLAPALSRAPGCCRQYRTSARRPSCAGSACHCERAVRL